MDDGIKTLDLHLCATCMVRSVAHFDSIYFRPSFTTRLLLVHAFTVSTPLTNDLKSTSLVLYGIPSAMLSVNIYF